MDNKCRCEKIVKEIISTEESYVKHLRLILKYFQEPLLESRLLPKHVISLIFSNLTQLIGVNEELLAELYERTIGEAFLSVTPYFKLYASYARSHEHALKTLMEWEQKNVKFSEFRRSQEMHFELSGLKLNALLITPVQRIPRYKLLLEELINNMDPLDSDYENIQMACEKIGDTASYINTHIKNYDNTQRMVEIQKRVGGEKKLNIMEPGRVFIKEGLLNKVCAKGKRSQERMLFLFSDMFMYAKVDSSGNYSACNLLPLHKCEVSTVLFKQSSESKNSQGGLFRICCLESQFLFYSESRKEVSDWLDALNTAISVYRQDRRSLRKESSGKRPTRAKQLNAKYKKMPLAKQSIVTNNNNNQYSSPLSQKDPQNERSGTKRSIHAVFSCTPVLKKKRRTSLL